MNRFSVIMYAALIAVIATSTTFADTDPTQPDGGQVVDTRVQDALDREQATAALIAAASTAEGDDQLIAVRALWLDAADGGFTDSASVATLQSLAVGTDPIISRVAQDALDDMAAYLAK